MEAPRGKTHPPIAFQAPSGARHGAPGGLRVEQGPRSSPSGARSVHRSHKGEPNALAGLPGPCQPPSGAGRSGGASRRRTLRPRANPSVSANCSFSQVIFFGDVSRTCPASLRCSRDEPKRADRPRSLHHLRQSAAPADPVCRLEQEAGPSPHQVDPGDVGNQATRGEEAEVNGSSALPSDPLPSEPTAPCVAARRRVRQHPLAAAVAEGDTRAQMLAQTTNSSSGATTPRLKNRVRGSTNLERKSRWGFRGEAAESHRQNSQRRREIAVGSRKYLSPEPMLQDPNYVRVMAMQGKSVPTYAYALNNPIKYIDPTGLDADEADRHDGNARGPGSFCALNPNGCPPVNPPNGAPPTDFCVLNPDACPMSPGGHSGGGSNNQCTNPPSNVNDCLAACDAGGEALKNFCRGITGEGAAWKRALCWSATTGSVAFCKGICYRIH